MDAARIALDAFGGDHCPRAEVEGAVGAARAGVHVILVGDEPRLRRELERFAGYGDLPLEIHHAPDAIGMADSPGKAIRNKPLASMPVAFDLVREGKAQAVMSAGNSGAMLGCGLLKFRRIKGVDRPALVASLPTEPGGFVALLDVGANIECRPINLVQFAVLGAVYASFKHGVARPRVGVLSNGTEDTKGSELTKAVHALLSAHPSEDFAYVGYVEGDGLYEGHADVIVTDGFSGNVALKVVEATAKLLGRWLRASIYEDLRSRLGGLFLRPGLTELKAKMNSESYGAAPLLGVDGMAFICHGRSSPFAIDTALRLAARSVTESLKPQLSAALERHRALFDASKDKQP